MLTCIACSKQLNNGSLHQLEEEEAMQTPSTKQAIKALTAQIKDMAVNASGAYKNCKPCSGSSNGNKNIKYADSDNGSVSARFNWVCRRTGSANSTARVWGKEMEAMAPIGQFAATHFRLLTAFRRSQCFTLKASMGPPEFTQQLNNSKLETLAEAKDGCDDISNDLKDRFLSFKKNMYMKNTEQFENLAFVKKKRFENLAKPEAPKIPGYSPKVFWDFNLEKHPRFAMLLIWFLPLRRDTLMASSNPFPPIQSRPLETNATLEFAVSSLLVFGMESTGTQVA